MGVRLERALLRFFSHIPPWEWLQGDGSNRAYARIHEGGTTLIAMVLADPDPHKQAEEIEERGGSEEIPFLAMQRLLREHGLPVPEVHAYEKEQGVILLEDLGDTLLAHCFTQGVPEKAYEKALEQLLRFQRIPPSSHLLFRRRFGLPLLLWEVEHFLEYGIEVRSGRKIPEEQRERWKKAWEEILDPLSNDPWVPVHRDYHSRNLMLDPRGELRWIDFQDALLGHPLYDLASLLYDAYVNLPEGFREEMLALFLKEERKGGLPPLAPTSYYLLALQRMLKAAGRFVYFQVVKGKPQYLRYLPELLSRCAAIRARFPQLIPGWLWEEMRAYVPEWQGLSS